MRKIEIRRLAYLPDSTMSQLYADNQLIGVTMEPGIYDKKFPLLPNGKYKCDLYKSPKFKRLVVRLIGIPLKGLFEIHQGNYPKDTKGCVLIGSYLEYSENGSFLKHSVLKLDLLISKMELNKIYDLEIKPYEHE